MKAYHEMTKEEQQEFVQKTTGSFKQRADDYREYVGCFQKMCAAIKNFAEKMPDTSKFKR
jgi:hypothetical protein